MVSHPETGSDSPIGSDQDRGRDIPSQAQHKRSVKKLKCITNVKIQTPYTHMNTNTNA